MKPFDAKELKVRIKNLIEQRKKLREHFLQEGIFNLDNKNIISIDRQFLEKVIKIINEHLSDSLFGSPIIGLLPGDIGFDHPFMELRIVVLK